MFASDQWSLPPLPTGSLTVWAIECSNSRLTYAVPVGTKQPTRLSSTPFHGGFMFGNTFLWQSPSHKKFTPCTSVQNKQNTATENKLQQKHHDKNIRDTNKKAHKHRHRKHHKNTTEETHKITLKDRKSATGALDGFTCFRHCVAIVVLLSGTCKLGFLFKKMKVSFGVHVKFQGSMKDNAGETKNANHPTWPPLRGSNWRPYLQSAPALRCHTRRGAPRRETQCQTIPWSPNARVCREFWWTYYPTQTIPWKTSKLVASRLDTSCFSGTLGRPSLGLHQFISPTKATSCVSPHKVGKIPHFFCVRELLKKFNSNLPSIVFCVFLPETLHWCKHVWDMASIIVLLVSVKNVWDMVIPSLCF